ncbi:MAG TPA: methyltransferase domain-containing protein [Stenomitos sp.]
MDLTQEEIISSRYKLQAAPVDSWRVYDEDNPIPGYFEFDWLSSRHPDLYHQYALSTVGLMEKLHTLMDLTNCTVLDIGAGTGRSAIGAAEKARRVFAIDWYQSVVWFGNRQLQQAQITNVYYINGNRDHLPLPENSVDVVINAWAELNPQEAYRVLKPNGYLIQLGAVPNALCGELTSELMSEYAWLPKDCAPSEVFEPGYPDTYCTTDSSIWDGIPVIGSIRIQQFTYVADYKDYSEIASMTGRLYGPKARQYFVTRKQSTFSWRLQIIMGQVSKPTHRK